MKIAVHGDRLQRRLLLPVSPLKIGKNLNLNKTQRYKMNMPYIPKDDQLWK